MSGICIGAASFLSLSTLFKTLIKNKVSAFILEIARSEIGYTKQPPLEYATVALAAAMFSGYKGSLILQGDHFQAQNSSQEELMRLRDLIRESINAGFGNIDLDMSRLVDYKKTSLEEQQELNALWTAELTLFIRAIEPEGASITIGGEVGEIGGTEGEEIVESAAIGTAEEVKVFVRLYREKLAGLKNRIIQGEESLTSGLLVQEEYSRLRERLSRQEARGEAIKGISKMATHIGSEHGEGLKVSIEEARAKIGEFSQAAREMNIPVFVVHAFSLAPIRLYPELAPLGAGEVHLTTRFQEVVFDNLPVQLWRRGVSILEKREAKRLAGYLKTHPEKTHAEAIQKERKRITGFIKEELWNLPLDIQAKIEKGLESIFLEIITALGIGNTLLRQELLPEFGAKLDEPEALPAAAKRTDI